MMQVHTVPRAGPSPSPRPPSPQSPPPGSEPLLSPVEVAKWIRPPNVPRSRQARFSCTTVNFRWTSYVISLCIVIACPQQADWSYEASCASNGVNRSRTEAPLIPWKLPSFWYGREPTLCSCEPELELEGVSDLAACSPPRRACFWARVCRTGNPPPRLQTCRSSPAFSK